MAKKNFYSVKAGRKTGIFTTWTECSASVWEYPKAQHKGFATKEEVEDYMNGFVLVCNSNNEVKQSIHESEEDKKLYYVVKKGRKIGLYNS